MPPLPSRARFKSHPRRLYNQARNRRTGPPIASIAFTVLASLATAAFAGPPHPGETRRSCRKHAFAYDALHITLKRGQCATRLRKAAFRSRERA